jgi:hypothetical protein
VTGLVVAAEEEHGVRLEEMDSGYSSLNDGTSSFYLFVNEVYE